MPGLPCRLVKLGWVPDSVSSCPPHLPSYILVSCTSGQACSGFLPCAADWLGSHKFLPLRLPFSPCLLSYLLQAGRALTRSCPCLISSPLVSRYVRRPSSTSLRNIGRETRGEKEQEPDSTYEERQHGYRAHTTMVRFAWAAESVGTKKCSLQTRASRTASRECLWRIR